jgi:uncharacterized membrane protein YdjX (TVP38/TMEM64 family)
MVESNTTKPTAKPTAPDWEKLLPAILVVLVISLLSVLAMQAFGGAEKIRVLVAGSGLWAPVVFMALKASTYVIAPLSGTPMKLAGGALFGVWEGLLYTTIGDLLVLPTFNNLP